jgi:hypothetical protein
MSKKWRAAAASLQFNISLLFCSNGLMTNTTQGNKEKKTAIISYDNSQ